MLEEKRIKPKRTTGKNLRAREKKRELHEQVCSIVQSSLRGNDVTGYKRSVYQVNIPIGIAKVVGIKVL